MYISGSRVYLATARTLSPIFPRASFAWLTLFYYSASKGISYPSTNILEHINFYYVIRQLEVNESRVVTPFLSITRMDLVKEHRYMIAVEMSFFKPIW